MVSTAPPQLADFSGGEPTCRKSQHLPTPFDGAGSDPVAANEERDRRVSAMVGAHFGNVWRTLRRLGLSPPDADDGTQQVFLVAAKKLDKIRPNKERAFLVGVAAKVAANARRNLAARHDYASTALVNEAPSAASSPEDLLDRRNMRELLDQILDAMPEIQRSVFVLFELEGFSTAEAAEALEVSVGTAASRLRLARGTYQRHVDRLRLTLGDQR